MSERDSMTAVRDFDAGMPGAEKSGKYCRRPLVLAVDKKNPLHPFRVELADIGEESRPVCVGAERIMDYDLRLARVQRSENPDFRFLVDEPFAERMLGLITDDQDHIPGVPDIVRKVMKNASRFTHPRRGNDHARFLQIVDLL